MILKRIKVNLKYYFILTFILVLFLFLIFFINFSDKISSKVTNLAIINIKKRVYENIMDIQKSINNEQLFKTVQDDAGQILYIDYDISKVYKIIDNLNYNIKEDNNIIIKVPYFLKNNNYFLVNLGPKINLKVNFIKMYVTNIYTKVTDYGLNNALLEIYLKLDIENEIIAPLLNENYKFEYDLLLASKVVNGKVPSLIPGNYGK